MGLERRSAKTAKRMERPRLTAENEPPPFLGSWPRVYAGVLSYLAVLIAILYLLTRVFGYL